MPKRRGGKRQTAGADHHLKLNLKVGAIPERITIHHEWDTKGLHQQFNDALKHVQAQVIDLQERAVADSLIKLGWCPPADHPMHNEAMDRLGYRKLPRDATGFDFGTTTPNEAATFQYIDYVRATQVLEDNAIDPANTTLDIGVDTGTGGGV